MLYGLVARCQSFAYLWKQVKSCNNISWLRDIKSSNIYVHYDLYDFSVRLRRCLRKPIKMVMGNWLKPNGWTCYDNPEYKSPSQYHIIIKLSPLIIDITSLQRGCGFVLPDIRSRFRRKTHIGRVFGWRDTDWEALQTNGQK